MWLSDKREYVKMDPIEKAKIVVRVEARLGNILIDPSRMECLEGCHCDGCFQKALDLLVTQTEVAVNMNLSQELDWVN